MELAIRLIDKGTAKAGDVIEALPDGSHWGTEGARHPEWRIIRSPILQTLADMLLAGGVSATPGQPAPYRAHRLDLSKLPNLKTGHPAILSIPAAQVIAATR